MSVIQNYHAKRLWQAVFTLFMVITITFFLYRLMPGGPVEAMRAQLITEAMGSGGQVDMDRINHLVQLYTNIQPDQPLYVQYFEYMRDIVLYQDFGQSIFYGDPVFVLLFKAMAWSIFVSVYGLAIGFTANIVLGALMATHEGTRFDSGMTVFSIVMNSIPYYVGAVLMLAFLAFQWNLFPTGGRYPSNTTPGLNPEFMLGVLHHAALPIASTILIGFGGAALAMRGNCVRVMGSNYLRVARLRGLSDTRIALRYVGRNAILPMYTGFMISIASVFGSSIIMEQIFTYPGVGYYTYDALINRDYPLLMGILIFFSAVTVIGVLVADFTYGMIDPRANTDQEEY